MIKNLWTKFIDTIAPIKEPEVSTLDMADGIIIPCPASHGARCTCTWY